MRRKKKRVLVRQAFKRIGTAFNLAQTLQLILEIVPIAYADQCQNTNKQT
jgi:hypothetical protein